MVKTKAMNTTAIANLLTAVASVPQDKQALVALVAETFINGMEAQRKLTGSGGVPHPPTGTAAPAAVQPRG